MSNSSLMPKCCDKRNKFPAKPSKVCAKVLIVFSDGPMFSRVMVRVSCVFTVRIPLRRRLCMALFWAAVTSPV